MKNFVSEYLAAALFTASEEDGEPVTDSICDLPPETVAKAEADCAEFFSRCAASGVDPLADYQSEGGKSRGESAPVCAHDFHYTRNGHGVGFWEEIEPGTRTGRKPAPAEILCKVAQSFPVLELYRGDDEKRYF